MLAQGADGLNFNLVAVDCGAKFGIEGVGDLLGSNRAV